MSDSETAVPQPFGLGEDQSFPIQALFQRPVVHGGDLPQVLYHYTNADGLIGILRPSSWGAVHPALEKMFAPPVAQLKASHVRYMNDTEELLYGVKVFAERFRTAAEDASTPETWVAAFNRLADVFSHGDVFNWGLGCFASSFCECGDLLSQWRGYGGGIGGYAIGFSWDALAKYSEALYQMGPPTGTFPFAADLRRVEYGKAAAEVAADRFIGWMRNSWSREESLIRTIVQKEMGVAWLASAALRELAVVKHEGFKEESEWRLSVTCADQYPVEIRARPSGLLPYLDIAVNVNREDAASHPPTIAKLVVGPCPDPPAQVAAAQELLKANGHDPDVVTKSNVPFRG